MNLLKFSLAIIILFTVVLILALGQSLVQAQREPSLAELALKVADLDKTPGIAGSRLVKSAPTFIDDPSQPLNKSTVNAFMSLLNYSEAYAMEAGVWDGESSAYIGNYLYRYPDWAQAESAASHLIMAILQSPSGKLLAIQPQAATSDVRGRTAMFIGSEGDAIYWFVGTKGRTLMLMMVNGMPTPSTQKIFEALGARMTQR